MINWIQRKRNKKGFTLIELIVVIAILGILAAIAIPRFTGMRERSAINADAATAQQMVSAARIVEAELNMKAGTALTGAGVWAEEAAGDVGNQYMVLPEDGPKPASAGTDGVFAVTYDEDDQLYEVGWTPTGYAAATYTEGSVFEVPEKE